MKNDRAKAIEENILWAYSGVNMKGEPFVQLRQGKKTICQMSMAEATDHAVNVMRCVEAALTDAMLAEFSVTVLGLDPMDPARGALLFELRKFREKWEDRKTSATSMEDAMPPDGDIEGPQQ